MNIKNVTLSLMIKVLLLTPLAAEDSYRYEDEIIDSEIDEKLLKDERPSSNDFLKKNYSDSPKKEKEIKKVVYKNKKYSRKAEILYKNGETIVGTTPYYGEPIEVMVKNNNTRLRKVIDRNEIQSIEFYNYKVTFVRPILIDKVKLYRYYFAPHSAKITTTNNMTFDTDINPFSYPGFIIRNDKGCAKYSVIFYDTRIPVQDASKMLKTPEKYEKELTNMEYKWEKADKKDIQYYIQNLPPQTIEKVTFNE